MPRAYSTYEQRRRAEFEKDRNQQLRAIQGEIALTKYKNTAEEMIKKKNKESTITEAKIKKIRKDVSDAEVGELFDYCYAVGKRLMITIE